MPLSPSEKQELFNKIMQVTSITACNAAQDRLGAYTLATKNAIELIADGVSLDREPVENFKSPFVGKAQNAARAIQSEQSPGNGPATG